jgi:hypothetical protein
VRRHGPVSTPLESISEIVELDWNVNHKEHTKRSAPTEGVLRAVARGGVGT